MKTHKDIYEWKNKRSKELHSKLYTLDWFKNTAYYLNLNYGASN